jgi:AraC-like DNA-binding protein
MKEEGSVGYTRQGAVANGIYDWFGSDDKQIVSRNLDEVASLLRQRVGPQQYDIRGSSRSFHTKLRFAELKDMQLSHAWFAPAMEITSTPVKPYYSLFFRLYGSSEYRCDGKTFVTSASLGALLPGMRPVHVRTNENWHVFGTHFAPPVIQTELTRLLGRSVARPVEFEPMVDFNRGAGFVLKRMLLRLYNEARRPDFESAKAALGMTHIEKSLIDLLLEGLRHNYSKFVNGPDRPAAPWQVRATEEFMRENADQPLSLGDLATVGGVSARSLQYTFRRTRGCSPMEFLRRVRLERVRNELLHAVDDTTVTSAGMRWGFLHLGRLAADYRATFSESPSVTLRRSLLRQS